MGIRAVLQLNLEL